MNKSSEVARRRAWSITKVLAVFSLIAGVIYWFRFSPIAVSSHTIERGSIVAEVMGTGTLEARVVAAVSPKIAGRIGQLFADQGDRVQAGDLLVQLDDEELQQQVEIAQANVEAARAGILRLTADKDRATAAFAQADKSNERVLTLARQKASSQDDVDKATETLAVAVTGVTRAEAAITEGQKQLVAAEKTLEYHRARLADCRIVAPFGGVIVNRNREPGDVVVPGSLILRLISTDQVWINAWVDETEIERLAPDQPARIVFRSEPTRPYDGKVIRLGKETDRETREFIVDVDVLTLPENWAVGQRADAFIEVARNDDAILVPARLIVNRDGQAGVFVATDNAAHWKPLTIGLRNRDVVEAVEGVQPGDIIVQPIDAKSVLTDGRGVTIP
ncbi:MAG: efflux RND transporter periplasmic adaptor subunit [Planctomycetaceae bacterium]